MQPALTQPTVYLALESRVQTTQGCRINCVAVLCMAITMLYRHNKIVNHVLLMSVWPVQTTHLARLALAIWIKTILVFCPTAIAQSDTIPISLSRITAYVKYNFLYKIIYFIFSACAPLCANCKNSIICL